MANSSTVIAEDSSSNSAIEHLDKDDNDDALHMHTRKLFRIDTSKIESVPHCQQNAELQALGLHVYNQDTFEQGQSPDICSFYLCQGAYVIISVG